MRSPIKAPRQHQPKQAIRGLLFFLLTSPCGLDDDDAEAISKFMEAVEPGWCVGCSDAPSFAWTHDAIAFAKAGDCLEFQFQTI